MEFKLDDCFKSFSKGQDKARSPEDTVEHAMAALSKLETPVLKKVSRIDQFDRLKIPVFTCEVDERTAKKYNALKSSWGKGADAILSKASALMELVERYSCISFIRDKNNYRLTSYNELKRGTMDSGGSVYPVYKDYSEDHVLADELKKVPMKWFESFSLTENRAVTFPLEWFVEFHGSSGMCAGNTKEEAILQGICELVERHTISTVVDNELSTPLIDIASIDNPIAQGMIDSFHKAGIELYIKDLSLGFGIPTIAVLAFDRDPAFSIVRVYCAAGTCLNRDAALARALTEVAQHRCQTLFLNRNANQVQPHTACFPYYRNLREAKYLVDDSRVVKMSDLPTYQNDNFKEEVEMAVNDLAKKGFEVIITDTTDRMLKIPTYIITTPGTLCRETDDDPYLIVSKYYKKAEKYRKSVKMIERYVNVDPFILYTFDNEDIARQAMVDLSYTRMREETGRPLSTEALTFASYPEGEGKWNVLISGSAFSYSMWKEAKESFGRLGGHHKGDMKPLKKNQVVISKHNR
ncbi:YcaO-like family protein [Chloroflexota bacterium]